MKHINTRTPQSRVIPEKLTVPQLVKKFPESDGTRMFITAFTTVPPPTCPCLRPDQTRLPLSHFLKINFIIIPAYTHRSSKRSFPSGFPTKILCGHILCPILASHRLDLITRIIVVNTDHKAPRFPLFTVTSSHLHPSIFVSTSFV